MSSKNPGKVGFTQPQHGQGKTSSVKNKSKVGFSQPSHGKGKTSAKKSPGKVGFSQPNHGIGGTTTRKNASKVGFDQPNRAGKSVSMPKADAKNVGKGAKIKAAKNVGPFAGKKPSVDGILAFRKKKYGV